jgi:outer membrane protein assembly factor BamB
MIGKADRHDPGGFAVTAEDRRFMRHTAMTKMHRACSILLRSIILLACLFLLSKSTPKGNAQAVAKQAVKAIGPIVVPANAAKEGEFTDAISLPTDRKVRQNLEAAEQDYIKSAQWAEASKLLQSVLMSKEDVFVQVRRKGPDGQEKVRWVSARAEANRLLATMPSKGLDFYEVLFGAQSKSRLDEAKKNGDPQGLAEVAQRYFHTEAGAQAADLLGTYHLDRGRPLMAALCFKRLLEREGANNLSPLVLFKAALAFRLSGDPAYVSKAQQTMDQLATRLGGEGLRVGDESVTFEQLQQELARAAPVETAGSLDWPLFRGNLSRSARGRGSDPFLESRWHKSTIEDNLQSETQHWIEDSLHHRSRPETLMPAFFPVATGGKLIYRGYSHITAVDIKSGEILWKSIPMKASLDDLARDANKKQQVQEWYRLYLQGSIQPILFENSNLGTLSTDGIRVYAVDDMALPPHPSIQQNQPWGWNNGGSPLSGPLQDLSQHSRLVAFDLESGKFVWERGDPKEDTTDLGGSYFLGPPLPLGGKLYVLTEKNAELRLVCLEAAQGNVAWSQTLATARNKLLIDVSRRVQAVHLAYAEGILVCPTNAGAVLGVDLLSRSLVWAFPYREKTKAADPPMQRFGRRMVMGIPGQDQTGDLQGLSSQWKMSAPIVADGKVVFTAADGGAIHCLNLQDGNSLWQAERRDDLYLAGVYQGKVILVGKNTCRALNLADGKQQLWQVETGLPSGLGVASGGFYYLPLRKGAICKIDLEKGQVVATSSAPRGEIPGNLLFCEGDVVSQNEAGITVFDQVDSKVAAIDAQLQKNPKDAAALTERGEMRLYKGDLAGAVADLRLALANGSPSPKLPMTRERLYTSLTELMHLDFDTAEQYLNEYKDLCKVPIPAGATTEEKEKLEKEQRRRQAGYLCLLGRGREHQKRFLDAFRAYLDYGSLAEPNERISIINEPAVTALPVVWARGRIAALAARATPEQRKAIEDEIDNRWHAVKDSKKPEELQHFVDTFGCLFRPGREAILKLAQREAERHDYIKAERYLLQLHRQHEDASMSGQAVEALARLAASQGLMDHAMYYYRLLRHDFERVTIRDGKSGADIYRDLATDKRFLPYLDEVESSLFGGTVKAVELPNRQHFARQQTYFYESRTEVLPFFQRHRLAWTTTNTSGMNSFQFKLFDRDSDEAVWTLPGVPTRILYNAGNLNSVRYPYFTSGHLVVLSLGHTVCGLDPVNRQKLWEKDLVPSDHQNNDQPFGPAMVSLDADGALLLHNVQGGVTERIGQIGPVTPSAVALRTLDGLSALDPVRGDVLWTKTDVSPHTRIFGDDDLLYLAELRDESRVGSVRAVSTRDGSEVKVPDFSSAFQHRRSVLGSRLLVSEEAAGATTLRLYDVRAGKDLWKKVLPAKSVVLRTETPELAGMVEPDGKLTVLSLQSGQEIFHAQIKPNHLEKVNDGLLLVDEKQYYVILNRPGEGSVPSGGPLTNLGQLRADKVNGMVYAFHADTGKLSWYLHVANQMILVEQFADLPIVVFSAKYNQSVNGAGNYNHMSATMTVDKRTGKRLYDKPQAPGFPPPAQGQFFSLHIDRQKGTIDLIANSMRLRHTVSAPGVQPTADLEER